MTDSDIVEIAGLIQRKWSEAAKTVNLAMTQRSDGSPDSAAFLQSQCENALAEERKWNAIQFRFIEEHGPVIRAAFGLSH
jgi:hypothetical protein